MSRRVALALLAVTVAQVGTFIARPLTSYRVLGLGGSARDVGLVAASFALLPLFLALPLGRVADRRLRTWLLVAGCSLQLVASVWLALGNTVLELAGASTVLGLGHLALTLGSQAVIARESADRHHDRDFGLLTAGLSLAQLVGPLIGGAILGDRSGRALVPATSHAFWVGSVFLALSIVCALAAARGSAGEEEDGPREPARAREILGTPGVVAAMFAGSAVLATGDVFTAYLPVLGDQRGIAPSTIGIFLALRSAFSLTSRVGIVTIVRHVGRVRLIAFSAVAAAVALAGMAAVHDVVALAVLSAVVGAALGFGQPLSMTIVVQLVPQAVRGTALALRLTGNRLGQIGAPSVAGVVAGSAGTGAVFLLVGGLLVAAAAAVLVPVRQPLPVVPQSEP